MAKPLCFMVMPFGTKAVAPVVDGAPARIDFDLLWHDALDPALRALGYETFRADQDSGAMIIHEMLERLYFSDLVVADMTLPNGNVYYEVGIRHAARDVGCVLVAAEWSRPLFDTQQMRRLTYPLKGERVDEAGALAIQKALHDGIHGLAQGESPMNIVLPGYPNPDPQRATTMRQVLEAEREFQSQVAAVRLQPAGEARKAAARVLAAQTPAADVTSASRATAIVTTLRDADLWDETRDFIEKLPLSIRERAWMQQQRALALSKARSSDHLTAIATLQELIRREGGSAESFGLIGGRYKRLADAARTSADGAAKAQYRQYLNQAIAAYEKGMAADLAGYYPVSNLARLYRERNAADDAAKADFAQRLTKAACEALKARGGGDEWLKPTLLGAAFDIADLATATELTGEVESEGADEWKLKSTIEDLRRSVGQIRPDAARAPFADLLARLEAILPPAA